MALTLTDTNILLRSADSDHALHPSATDAVDRLRLRGDRPCLVPQNLIEFRAVATRPAAANGLGMSQARANAEIALLETLYPVFPDVPAVFTEWKRLVSAYTSEGKQNHDARIVAAMLVHGIDILLTFNRDDFLRYPEITVLAPQDVLVAT
jgi:predicted nucleic acid-binding protein